MSGGKIAIGSVFSTTLQPLYLQENPGTPCTGGWVGFRAGVDAQAKSRPTRIRSSDRPVRCQSLYRLSYRGRPLPHI